MKVEPTQDSMVEVTRREVKVDLEVYHKIWSLWRAGDTDENSILRRVLTGQGPPISDNEPMQTLNQPAEKEERAMKVASYFKRVRWVDDVEEALRRLGNVADLSEIYRMVAAIRQEAGRHLVENTDATIRQAIESHSSDSEAFQGRADLFERVGRGRWQLRSR